MKRFAKVGLGFGGAAVLAVLVVGFLFYGQIQKTASEDPKVWTDDVRALVEATRARGPLDGAVLFTGSSSIRFWYTLEEDMKPLVTIRHGFGGAKLGDLEFFAKELVNAFEPRAVVVFAGSNDIQPGNVKPPEVLLATYRRFVAKVREDLPSTPIYFIGITPSPLRFSVWDHSLATNRLIREFSEGEPNLRYIETGPSLMGEDGEPDPDNYRFDGLHLSEAGYKVWTRIIRTRLLDDLGTDA